MTGPPIRRSGAQAAVGAGPLGETTAPKSAWVKVVNPVWNGSGFIKRKAAAFYIAEGRAELVGTIAGRDGNPQDLIRLIPSHPKNQAAARRSAQGYEAVRRMMTTAEMTHLPLVRPRKSTGWHGALGRSTVDRVLFHQAANPRRSRWNQ